jgi:small subunit ribosomal protein S7
MEIKLFNRWSTKDVVVPNPVLEKYISLEPRIIPHSFGRHAKEVRAKCKVFIVERFINRLMRSGIARAGKLRGKKGCGKKLKMMKAVEEAFEIIEKRTKQNPIQILVNAIVNSAPRETTVRLQQGGAILQKAVDCAPTYRIDFALKNLSIGILKKCHKSKKTLPEAIAEELIAASNDDYQKSYAVMKKRECERAAAANR